MLYRHAGLKYPRNYYKIEYSAKSSQNDLVFSVKRLKNTKPKIIKPLFLDIFYNFYALHFLVLLPDYFANFKYFYF